jgi:thiamine biosynthesis lipoprotein
MQKHIVICGETALALAALALAALACAGEGAGQGGAENAPSQPESGELQLVRREQPAMGTQFAVQLVTPDVVAGAQAIDAAFVELERVEALISEWRDSSEISAVNRQAGVGPVLVGADLLAVMTQAMETSRLTGGAFDVTFAGCGGLWSIREERIPSTDALAGCLPLVDYREIEIDSASSTVFLRQPGSRAGLGGIGQGYGVDRMADVLVGRGFTDFIIDGSGDILVRGRHLSCRPAATGGAAGSAGSRGAVVTSGTMSGTSSDGVRYHHILDHHRAASAARWL